MAAPVLAFVVAVVGVVASRCWRSARARSTAFRAMFSAIDSADAVVNIINRAAPYYVMGLAVALGFKMGLFNIGADGQYRIGALLAAAAGAAVTLPAPLHVLFVVLVAMVGAGAYAAIAGVLKVTRGRERGRLDHHAQLHRHRHHRLPAVRAPAQQQGVELQAETKPLPTVRLAARRSTGRSPGSATTCRRRVLQGFIVDRHPHRHRLLPRRVPHPLRLRPARPRAPTPAPRWPAASTPRR